MVQIHTLHQMLLSRSARNEIRGGPGQPWTCDKPNHALPKLLSLEAIDQYLANPPGFVLWYIRCMQFVSHN